LVFDDTELDRLANTELLALSQVCSWWHSIVFDTPTLWSTPHLHGILWRTPYTLAETVTLLSAALTRSRNAPLSVVAIFEHKRSSRPLLRPRRKHVFQLLFQHSCRWWAAEFYSSVDIDSSCLQAKFSLLQHLTLQDEQKAEMLAKPPHTVDFFVRPRR
jgi:hypothetical protein